VVALPLQMKGDGYVSLGLSHGTAGVAYALAAAAQRLRRPDLLQIAQDAAHGMIAIADQPDGWALPVRIPPRGQGQLPVMFGWCHGVAGTIRLFGLLNSIDPQPEWAQAVEASLRAIRASRLPERLFPGYWDNVGRCCGTASVGQLLTQLAISSGDRGLIDWAQQLAHDLLDRTRLRNTADGRTLACWSNTDYQAPEPELPARSRPHARRGRNRRLARHPPSRRRPLEAIASRARMDLTAPKDPALLMISRLSRRSHGTHDIWRH
jgi:Lanthionine synthetase C-like protein